MIGLCLLILAIGVLVYVIYLHVVDGKRMDELNKKGDEFIATIITPIPLPSTPSTDFQKLVEERKAVLVEKRKKQHDLKYTHFRESLDALSQITGWDLSKKEDIKFEVAPGKSIFVHKRYDPEVLQFDALRNEDILGSIRGLPIMSQTFDNLNDAIDWLLEG